MDLSRWLTAPFLRHRPPRHADDHDSAPGRREGFTVPYSISGATAVDGRRLPVTAVSRLIMFGAGVPPGTIKGTSDVRCCSRGCCASACSVMMMVSTGGEHAALSPMGGHG